MDRILASWNVKGLHSKREIESKEGKRSRKSVQEQFGNNQTITEEDYNWSTI